MWLPKENKNAQIELDWLEQLELLEEIKAIQIVAKESYVKL